MKKILILGAGIYQVPLIKTAKRMGLYSIVVSIPGNYPGFALADKVYYENTTDADKIMEIAETEELFAFPLHPYTKSLISAIPIPDPKIEKEKKLFIYDKSLHDYSKEQPELVDIGNGHMVYGSPSEIAKYMKIRFG